MSPVPRLGAVSTAYANMNREHLVHPGLARCLKEHALFLNANAAASRVPHDGA